MAAAAAAAAAATTAVMARAGMRVRSRLCAAVAGFPPCACSQTRRAASTSTSSSTSSGSGSGSSSSSSSKTDSSNAYGATMFMPNMPFPQIAPVEVRETPFRARTTTELYHWQQKNNTGPLFVLHDGPPYANGSLHTGHAMNKVLKDIINRYNVLIGNRVHYLPGWDCHGLPIELKATQSLQDKGKGKEVDTSTSQDVDDAALRLRATAANFALETIQTQKAEFAEFAIMTDWSKENTYRTLDRNYEANQLQVFGQMARSGLIYRQFKPVYWSPSTKTALAEAELEYNETHSSKTAYVRFPLAHVGVKLSEALNGKHIADGEVDLVIWTTTPWTLPANAAVAVHQDLEYCLVRSQSLQSRPMIIGKDLMEHISKLKPGRHVPKGEDRQPLGELEVLATFSGAALLDSTYRHPFLPSASPARPIFSAAFVTATAGTGLVHCAPAHGADDYELCRDQGVLSREGLLSPVDDNGKYTAEVGEERLVGLDVLGSGGREVLAILTERGALLSEVPIKHKYPYDWRSKKPVITRATSQWFANLDRIKDSALKALESVTFVPPTGRNRLEAFIRSRSEWCISRQRAWGVPLPVLYDVETDEPLITETNVAHIASVLAERGTDHWWAGDVDEFVAPAHRAEGRRWRKGRDTVDVWFDSGVSWTLLRDLRPQQPYADVYLEGSDQHRGWFQSSLLTAVAVAESNGSPPAAPFRQVVTHGFVVDEQGKKMSKSIGNVLSPLTILRGDPAKQKVWPAWGADLLRFWVARSDYTSEVPVGPTVLKKSMEALRAIRNSCRFLLGNLPQGGTGSSAWSSASAQVNSASLSGGDSRLVPGNPDLSIADRLIMLELRTLEQSCRVAYEAFDFAQVMRRVDAFKGGPMSKVFIDTSKDALYADAESSTRRQISLVVMDHVLRTLVGILAPVTPHFAEEVFSAYHRPQNGGEQERASSTADASKSVFQRGWQGVGEAWDHEGLRTEMGRLTQVRDAVLSLQESARTAKHIRSSLMADVKIFGPADNALLNMLRSQGEEKLADFLLVSHVTFSTSTDGESSMPGPATGEGAAAFSLAAEVDGVRLELLPARAHKCPRCWTFRREEAQELCTRCDGAVLEFHAKHGTGATS